jgi:hypothetical protein
MIAEMGADGHLDWLPFLVVEDCHEATFGRCRPTDLAQSLAHALPATRSRAAAKILATVVRPISIFNPVRRASRIFV